MGLTRLSTGKVVVCWGIVVGILFFLFVWCVCLCLCAWWAGVGGATGPVRPKAGLVDTHPDCHAALGAAVDAVPIRGRLHRPCALSARAAAMTSPRASPSSCARHTPARVLVIARVGGGMSVRSPASVLIRGCALLLRCLILGATRKGCVSWPWHSGHVPDCRAAHDVGLSSLLSCTPAGSDASTCHTLSASFVFFCRVSAPVRPLVLVDV